MSTKPKAAASDLPLTVEIVPWSASTDAPKRLAQALLAHDAVGARLAGTRHRILSTEFVEPSAKPRGAALPRRVRTTFYDYDRNRTLDVESDADDPRDATVVESTRQPLPSPDEFREAVEILTSDAELGERIRRGELRPYRPMPPLAHEEDDAGHVERTLAVGLLPREPGGLHEIVGVNLARRSVRRFPRGAPPRARAGDAVCGVADAGQDTPTRGTPGQARITVRRGGRTLWQLYALRPAASSGTNGSGIELRFVSYRGKRVLHRAHVPILNVRYDHDACGPYRDWQWQESMLQADGTDPAPGFRLCSAPGRTVLDTESDDGNFNGVAVYVDGDEVVLVSEMEAGWYRYISEWRLAADGTIRPRFGFAAVHNSCVCNKHHHHVYWRLDFDIRTARNNVVEEFNDPPLGSSTSPWSVRRYEGRRRNDVSRKRRWRVRNGDMGYEIVPGHDDGVADDFGVGDFWVLRYDGAQIDDGQAFTTDPAKARADIDRFVDGKLVEGQDVVIWYAAHFTHDVSAHVGHIVGPELVPFNW